MADAKLDSRVTALERRFEQKTELVEAWTVPPSGDNSAFFATHGSGEVGGVWLAPLRLQGRMRVRRLSAIVKASSGATNPAALAVYRVEMPLRSAHDNPDPSGLRFRLMKATNVLNVASPLPTRLDFDLPADLLIDSELLGPVFVGYQGGNNLSWYGAPLADPGLSGSYRTNPLGARIGDFPAALLAGACDAPTPIIRALSALGRHVYAKPNTSTGTPASTGAGIIKITPSPEQVTGTTATHIGSVELSVGTLTRIAAHLGCVDPTQTATLELRLTGGGALVASMTQTGALSVVSISSVVVTSAWHELWMRCSAVVGTAICRGVEFIP